MVYHGFSAFITRKNGTRLSLSKNGAFVVGSGSSKATIRNPESITVLI
jgi:hypothetical protein